jgi:uncharacterized protein YndB with AHSA1/START domain
VFAAFADPKSKAQWFVGPEHWERSNHKLDFRIGGKESVSSGPPGGPVHAYNAIIWDIVENERIVTGYDMHLDTTRISVSLGTTEIRRSGAGSTLLYTEQGAFLDGFDDAGSRERGTQDLFNNLDAFLKR